MTYILTNNKVQFKKGTKPTQIREAQRLVRDTYKIMCQEEAPRSAPLAQAYVIGKFDKGQLAAIEEAAPMYKSAIMSAARAYARMGSDLLRLPMYSMDVAVPLSDLSKIKDLPEEIVTKAREAGVTELLFMAREI
jgi:hypothetical protein